jgi:uncharacterized protein YdaU (DUF1376 family)
MHYFKRNIGDYHKKAGRLTMLEHGAYTLLMDACYDRERFPTIEEAIDWCWATSQDEVNAVKVVLTRFFCEREGVYVQQRISEEIAAYHEKAEKNKEIAIAREKARRTNRARIVHEPCTDGHLTNNHKPITNNHNKSNGAFAPPTVDQVRDYVTDNRYPVDPEKFCDFYASKGWMVGKNKMKDWKAAVRTWSKGNENTKPNVGTDPNERGISGAERTRRARELLRRQEGQHIT